MKDLFSGHSREYALFRPDYPVELAHFILSQLHEAHAAWDCATGNGQLAVKLSDFFDVVYATDLSKNQIANAINRKNIIYKTASAENAVFNVQFDLITIAQAIHWFDFGKFYSNARQYLKPAGVIAAIGYGLIRIDEACDPVINHLYRDILGAYWDPERRFIDDHYRTIPFPFREIDAPEFELKASWNWEQLIGYFNTWSSVKHYADQQETNPVSLISNKLRKAWGTKGTKEVAFPLFMRLGKKV